MQSAPHMAGSALPGCCACLINNIHECRICDQLDSKLVTSMEVEPMQVCYIMQPQSWTTVFLDKKLLLYYYMKNLKAAYTIVPEGNHTDLNHCWICTSVAYSKDE